jgi:hypothetical protein
MNAPAASAPMHAHWNAVIHKTLLMHGVSLDLLEYGETSTAKLPKECHVVIGQLCKELLTMACESQTRNSKLMAHIERRINQRLWNALQVYSKKILGQWQQLEIDPYSNQPVTPPSRTDTRRLQTSAQLPPRRTRP